MDDGRSLAALRSHALVVNRHESIFLTMIGHVYTGMLQIDLEVLYQTKA